MIAALSVTAALLVVACGDKTADKPEKPSDTPAEIELLPQPAIKNGFRSAYRFEGADAAALQRAVRVLRIRYQLAKIASYVSLSGDEVIVDLEPADEEALEHARELVRRAGRFEVRFAEAGSAYMKALAAHVETDPDAARVSITSSQDSWKAAGKQISDWYLRASDRRQEVTAEDAKGLGCATGISSSARVICRITGRQTIEAYVAQLAARDRRFVVPDDRMLVYEHVDSPDAAPYWRTTFGERKPEVTNGALERATVVDDPHGDRPLLKLELDRATGEALSASTVKHIGHKRVVAVDGQVWSAPIYPGDKASNPLWITIRDRDARRAEAEARELAIILSSGPLPGPTREEYRAELVDGVAKSPEP